MVHGLETMRALNDAHAENYGRRRTRHETNKTKIKFSLPDKGANKNLRTWECDVPQEPTDLEQKSDFYKSSNSGAMIPVSAVEGRLELLTEEQLLERRHTHSNGSKPVSYRDGGEVVPIHLLAKPTQVYAGKPKY